MGKFDELLEVADGLKGDKIVEYVKDGYPVYTDAVMRFEHAVYRFHNENPDYGLKDYWGILEQNGFVSKLIYFDLSDKDARCVMAMLMLVIRGERFCEGHIAGAFNSGVVQRVFGRLRELNESE